MFDAFGDLVEILLAGGVSSPETLGKQRVARLVASVVGLAVNLSLCLLLGASALRGWSAVVLVVTTIAAAWALLFSIADVVKELPSVAWLSVAATVAAAGGIAAVALLALRIMPAAG